MSWTYDSGNSRVSASGGSKTSPNKISDAAITVYNADNTKAKVQYAADGSTVVYCEIIGVEIVLASGSWTKIDNDIEFTMKGSTHFSWKEESSSGANDGGSLIYGERCKVYVNTDVLYHEGNSEVDMTTGCSFVCERDDYGNNPTIILNSSQRHDIITDPGRALADVDVQGISIHKIGGATPSFKWYMGYARNVTNLKNMSIDSDGEVFQLINVTVYSPTVKSYSIASNAASGDNRVTNVVDVEYIWSSDTEFNGNIRSALYTIKNPIWTGSGHWDGTVNWTSVNVADYPRFWIVYQNDVTVLDASNSNTITGTSVRFDRANVGTVNYTTVDSHAAYYNETTDSNGLVSKDLLDAYCLVSDGTNEYTDIDRYKWSMQVRDYDYLYPSQYVYEDRVYDSVTGTGKKHDYVFVVADDGVTLTETEANNLTDADDLSELYDIYKAQWVGGSFWDDSNKIDVSGKSLSVSDEITLSTTSDLLEISGSQISIKTNSVLDISTKFNGIIADKITFDDVSIGDDMILEGDIYLDNASDMDGVTITGDLYINTGANSTLDFSGVTISGKVFNSDTLHTLTINATNGSSLTADDPGSGNGQVDIKRPVTLKVKVLDVSSNPIQGARVYLDDGTTVLMNEITDSSGIASVGYNYIQDTAVTGRARKASSLPYYKTAPISGTITSNGLDVSVIMVKDT